MKNIHSWICKIAAICLLVLGVKLEAGNAFAQKIILDANGAGAAIWNYQEGSYFSVKAALISSSGSWSAPVTLSSAGESCSYPVLSMNSNGDCIVIWSTFDPTLKLNVLKGCVCPAGGSWGSETLISSPFENLAQLGGNMVDSAYKIDTSNAGVAIVVWNSYIGNNVCIRSSRFSGGSWSAPVTLQQ